MKPTTARSSCTSSVTSRATNHSSQPSIEWASTCCSKPSAADSEVTDECTTGDRPGRDQCGQSQGYDDGFPGSLSGSAEVPSLAQAALKEDQLCRDVVGEEAVPEWAGQRRLEAEGGDRATRRQHAVPRVGRRLDRGRCHHTMKLLMMLTDDT